MTDFSNYDSAYCGCDETGRLILTQEFQSSIDAHYAREGRARATDAAPDDFEFDDSERIARLQAEYDRVRAAHKNPQGETPVVPLSAFASPQLNDLQSEVERTRQRGERMSGISTEDHKARLNYFKRARAMDEESDEKVELYMELEAYYAAQRGRDRGQGGF